MSAVRPSKEAKIPQSSRNTIEDLWETAVECLPRFSNHPDTVLISVKDAFRYGSRQNQGMFGPAGAERVAANQ